MNLEEDINKNIDTTIKKLHKMMSTDIAKSSITISNKKGYIWIPDNMAIECNDCKIKFNLLVRKHHCRRCGNIFCKDCTNNTIWIPENIDNKITPEDKWNVSHYLKFLKTKEEKVCNVCFKEINEYISYKKDIEYLEKNLIDIDSILSTNTYQNNVKYYYFEKLRNLQYVSPSYELNSLERRLLHINSNYFIGHNRYITLYIKSIDWCSVTNYDLLKLKIENILDQKKVKKCDELLCNSRCDSNLTTEDCLEILYTVGTSAPEFLIDICFTKFNLESQHIILSISGFFLNLIKKSGNNAYLLKKIYELFSKKIEKTLKLFYRILWLLCSQYQYSTNLEKENINNFVNLYPAEHKHAILNSYKFFSECIDNSSNIKLYFETSFKDYLPIVLPYDPEIQILDVDTDNIIVKNSKTKPIIIPFITNMGVVKILLKNESLSNDVAVLNIMSLFDTYLNTKIDKNFTMISYPILPIGQDSGIIGIVDNSVTIHNIMENGLTIRDFITNQNPDSKIRDILNTYKYSLVSYTLYNYLLGLGDRHMQNIMITNYGHIFHIDFGFILGEDAYPLTNIDIKLNSDMVKVIGGIESESYQEYLELCSIGINLLRKYHSIAEIILLSDTNFEPNTIRDFIIKRFQPKQNDIVFSEELKANIANCRGSYIGRVKDYMYYHKQNGVSKIIKTAKNLLPNINSSNS